MGRPGLTIHPKFRRLVHLLAMPAPHVLGHLEYLWMPAYENGNPEIGDAVDIELAAGWQGEPQKLTKALLECGGSDASGFIEEIPGNPGRYQIHDLYDHAPEYVRKRFDREYARQAQGKTLSEIRAEAGRKGGKARKQTEANGSHLLSFAKQTEANGSKRLANGTPPAPAPAPAPNTDSSEPPPAASEPPILVFPIVGNGCHDWGLWQSKVVEYAETYPGIDAAAECRKARQWCIDNPAKRKTAKGMTAFLNRWMQKAQNDSARTNGDRPHQQSLDPEEASREYGN